MLICPRISAGSVPLDCSTEPKKKRCACEHLVPRSFVGLPCNLPVDMKRSERHKEHSHISHHQLQLSSTFPSDALVISRFDVFFPAYCSNGII